MPELDCCLLLDALADAVAVADASGRILRANAAMETLLGWPAGALIGQPLLDIFSPRSRAACSSLLQRRLENPDSSRTKISERVAALRRDGGEVDTGLSLSVANSPSGGNLTVVCLRDPGECPGGAAAPGDGESRARTQEVLHRVYADGEGQRFLAQAGTLLASSLDYETTLRNLARLSVPRLGDWCSVDILEDDGTIRNLAVEHTDPAKVELARDLQRRYPPGPDAPAGVPRVLRTGEPEWMAEIPDSLLAAGAGDEELLRLLRDLGLKSYMCVPLVARGRTLGAITLLATTESGRRYGEADLALAEDLARRAALSVDNARLFSAAQEEIAERRHAEEAQARLMAEVQAHRRRLDDILGSVPGVVWEAWGQPDAASQRIDFVSDYVETMLGYSVQEWLATPNYWLTIVHPEDRERASSEMTALFQGGRGGVCQFRWVAKDGRVLWVEAHSVVIRDENGTPVGMRGVTMDITERKQAEEALRRRAADLARITRALERSNRELDQFAYVTSHDLKAPLRGIANLSRWIEEDIGDALPAESRQQLEMLRGRVGRMEAMIEGILQYSRVGRLQLNIEPVDVGRLLREIIELLDPPPGFEIEVQPGMPTVRTKTLRLQQVFMNLLSNAIKHNPRPDGRVRVTWREAGEFYEFAVSDNGPGIAPQYHEKVFMIFQTLEARDKVENTGVGLALVKKIVEDQGGTIELESEEGRGATFRFTWPRQLRTEG